jgi:hypothetical protein
MKHLLWLRHNRAEGKISAPLHQVPIALVCYNDWIDISALDPDCPGGLKNCAAKRVEL